MPLPLLPPLNALRAFKVASLTGSFSLAADEMCVSQGAVSRHIAKLEDYLGVRLFDRTNREVRLTEVGAQYAAELQVAFERIEQATLRLHSERQRDRLKIGVFPSLANTWVMAKLQEYQSLHPDLALDIVCQTMFSDVDTHALDVMSMNTTLAYEGTQYLPLLEVELSPVCTAEIAEQIGDDPAALTQFTTLHSLRRPDHWAKWLEAAGIDPASCRATRHFENSALAYQASVAGMGVAISLTRSDNLLPVYRDLVRPFPLTLPIEESYGFAWRPSALQSPPVADFVAWFREQKRLHDSTSLSSDTLADQSDVEAFAA
ncbi:LysR substrate-binding domain-containing protein [Blastomonas fulva]|uniref:LysR substrate-binding domain-containing protein n=1 Tax=Blastomonas fulva TaxID=1550728 RepID=UPI003F6FA881